MPPSRREPAACGVYLDSSRLFAELARRDGLFRHVHRPVALSIRAQEIRERRIRVSSAHRVRRRVRVAQANHLFGNGDRFVPLAFVAQLRGLGGELGSLRERSGARRLGRPRERGREGEARRDPEPRREREPKSPALRRDHPARRPRSGSSDQRPREPSRMRAEPLGFRVPRLRGCRRAGGRAREGEHLPPDQSSAATSPLTTPRKPPRSARPGPTVEADSEPAQSVPPSVGPPAQRAFAAAR